MSFVVLCKCEPVLNDMVRDIERHDNIPKIKLGGVCCNRWVTSLLIQKVKERRYCSQHKELIFEQLEMVIRMICSVTHYIHV